MRKTLFLGAGGKTEKLLLLPDMEKGPEEIKTLDMQPPADVLYDLSALHLPDGTSRWTAECGFMDNKLPFSNEEFDEIHAYEVLEHFGQQGDYRAFFKEWGEYWRVLKMGGYFFFSCPHWDPLNLWGDPGHTRSINPVTIAFLCHEEYEKQKDGPMTNYRRWLVGNWKAATQIIVNKDKSRWGMILQKLAVPDTITSS